MSPIAYQSRYMDLESQFTHPVSQKKLLFGSLPLLTFGLLIRGIMTYLKLANETTVAAALNSFALY